MTRLKLHEVPSSDAETQDVLRDMHTICFAKSAPMPDFKNGYWWVAKDTNGFAGFCGLTKLKGRRLAGYLCRAGVLPSCRGFGLQRRFIKAREAKARELGWKSLETDTTNNLHSANNLIKAGFLLFEPKDPWGFDETLYWRKTLS